MYCQRLNERRYSVRSICWLGFPGQTERKEMDRYFTDERVGCIAVRDREATDPEYNRLHSDTAGVVRYWGGEPRKDLCPTCGHVRGLAYVVLDKARAEAYALCEELNTPNAELSFKKGEKRNEL